MRYGIVYFDVGIDKRVKTKKSISTGQAVLAPLRDGWASIDGNEAFPIHALANLPTDVVWMLNVEGSYFSALKLHASRNYVMPTFLKTRMEGLAAEIGADLEHERVSEIVRALSDVFSRTMRLCSKYFGAEMDVKPYGYKTKKLGNSIAAAIGKKTHTLDAVFSACTGEAFADATEVNAFSETPGEAWVNLRAPRYMHAYEILDMPVPSSHNWEFIEGAKLPPDQRARLTWALENPKPVIVRMRCADGRSKEAEITSFGTRGKDHRKPREWVCAPELYWLSKYYNTIEIESAYICNDGYAPMPELKHFPAAKEFGVSSISHGLVVQNFLAMLTEPYEPPRTENVAIAYPHSVWYAALDRFIMFTYAARLYKAGVGKPKYYGHGGLSVAYAHDRVDALTDVAAAIGLEVPASLYWKRTMTARRRTSNEGMFA